MNNTKIVVISKNDELVRLVEKVADYAVEHLSSYSAYENYYATILLHDVDTVIIEPKSLAELSKSSCLVYALTNQAIIPKNLELYTDIWTDWQNAGLLKKHLSSATQILILYEIKQFSIGVGHEMSAPLNSIQGYVELTTVIDVSEEQIASFLDIIRSNAQYIGHLIYDYRDWVAYKESTLIIIREPFILSDLIQKIKSGKYADLLHISYLEEQTKANVYGNSTYIIKILEELVSRSHVRQRSKTIIKIIHQKNMVQFSVQSDQAFITVHDDSWSLNPSWLYDAQFITYIIEQHNGKIWAEDEHTLHFTLPLAEKSDK